MQAKPNLLSHTLLRDLPPAHAQRLQAAMTPQSWGAGKLVFQRGDPGSFMAFIVSGKVQLSLLTPAGKEVLLRQVGPGDVLGEIAVIDGGERSADARAASATEAMILTRQAFLSVADDMPELYPAIARYLCAALRATNYQMESIALYDLQARLARFFLLACGSGQAKGSHVRVDMPYTQGELSALLGASRPKVNNALHLLQSEGAITRDGAGYLCLVSRLEDLAEPEDSA
jgi:CRP-like cAMP-binding protein